MSRIVLYLAALAGLSVSSAALADGDALQNGVLIPRRNTAKRQLPRRVRLSGPQLPTIVTPNRGASSEVVVFDV